MSVCAAMSIVLLYASRGCSSLYMEHFSNRIRLTISSLLVVLLGDEGSPGMACLHVERPSVEQYWRSIDETGLGSPLTGLAGQGRSSWANEAGAD